MDPDLTLAPVLVPFEEMVRLHIAAKEHNQHSHPSTLLPTNLVNF